eukprot:364699-Chlamydomonas_euryale.AAC.10
MAWCEAACMSCMPFNAAACVRSRSILIFVETNTNACNVPHFQITSLYLLGAAGGNAVGCLLASHIGPRRSLLHAAYLLLLSPLLTVCSPTFPFWNGVTNRLDLRPLRVAAMLSSRIAVGAASGVCLAVTPIGLTCEVASVYGNMHGNGACAATLQIRKEGMCAAAANVSNFAVSAGILVAAALNAGLPVQEWQAMQLLSELPALFFGIGANRLRCLVPPLTCMFLSPEGPSWLVSQRRTAETDASTKILWGSDSARLGETGTGGAYEAGTQPRSCLGLPLRPVANMNVFLHSSTVFLLMDDTPYAVCGTQAGFTGAQQTSLVASILNLLGNAVATRMPPKHQSHAICSSHAGQAVALFCIALASTADEPAADTWTAAGLQLHAFSYALGAGLVPSGGGDGLLYNTARDGGFGHPKAGAWLCAILLAGTFILLNDFLGPPNMCAALGCLAVVRALAVFFHMPR